MEGGNGRGKGGGDGRGVIGDKINMKFGWTVVRKTGKGHCIFNKQITTLQKWSKLKR
jgi:hypothetical protein